MNPEWAKKHPALADAVRTFPKRVFQEWLRLRRQGADEFFPKWRLMADKHHKVVVLNLGARLKAAFN